MQILRNSISILSESDISRALTSFQPLNELVGLLDGAMMLPLESFESIFRFRQCFNERGHRLRFSGGVLGMLHAQGGLHQPLPVASRRGCLPLFPL